MAAGKHSEACELLKSIRRLAHVNKNTPKKNGSSKKMKVGDIVDPELPSLKSLIPTLIHELANEASTSTPATPPAPTPEPQHPPEDGQVSLMREIRSLHHELFAMRQRLQWYEQRYPQDPHEHIVRMPIPIAYQMVPQMVPQMEVKPVIWEQRSVGR